MSYRRQSDIIDNVLYITNDSFKVTIEDYVFLGSRDNEIMKTFNLFFVDSYAAFENIYRQMKPEYFDYTGILI